MDAVREKTKGGGEQAVDGLDDHKAEIEQHKVEDAAGITVDKDRVKEGSALGKGDEDKGNT